MRSISIVRAFSMLVTPFILSGNSVQGGSDRSKGGTNTPPRYLILSEVYPIVRVCPVLYRYFKLLGKKIKFKGE